MPFLVSVVRGSTSAELIDQLATIYVALGSHWLRARRIEHQSASGWRELAAQVELVDQPIDLSDLGKTPPLHLVDAGRWPAIEIQNSLNHIEVLLAAAERLAQLGWKLSKAAPTQQHLDEGDGTDFQDGQADQVRMADLEGSDDQGKPFALEAYGGVNYGNNSKAAHDLEVLSKHPSERKLLAVRTRALPPAWRNAVGGTTVQATCAARHGGPYQAKGDLLQKWEGHGHSVLEVHNIQVVRPTR